MKEVTKHLVPIIIVLGVVLIIVLLSFSSPVGCLKGGGRWKKFGNTCADDCHYQRNRLEILCGQMEIYDCDCGPDKCWNGKACEKN